MEIILIPPCCSFGDPLAVIGLLYYLLENYNNVYFYLEHKEIRIFYGHYFKNDPLYNKRIFIIDNPELLINKGYYGQYHICNTLTASWDRPNELFKQLPNINQKYYFNDENPFYNNDLINVYNIYTTKPNKHLPNNILSINHLFYYELVGLNDVVRMHFFKYVRNKEVERIYSERNNPNGEKYNIINDPYNKGIHIDNGYRNINIHYLAEHPGYLLSLIEGAEEIHLIEGNNANFIYHNQFIKNIDIDKKKVVLRVDLYNRNWPMFNLDYAWKMMATKKLDNWEFRF